MQRGVLMSSETGEAFERDFDLLMAERGIVVPADRRNGAIRAYAEIKRMAASLRLGSGAEMEPANVFNVATLLRDE